MSWEIAITFGIVATAFTLIYLGLNLKEEHSIVKFFFLMIGLFMLITQLAMNEKFIRANELNINNATVSTNLINQSNSVYNTAMWVGILLITYFFVYFMFNIFAKLNGGNQKPL